MKASRLPIVSALTAILFTCTAFNVHAETQQISGTTTGGYTKQQPVPIANADGNLLIISEYHGTNKSTSGNGYMDGASVINQEIAQLFQGNGDNSGYITFAKGDGVTVGKWSGHVTTVMKDGNPVTTFKGDWEYVSGTGKYAGIKGKGDYSGYFTSQTAYVVEWKGNYSLGN